MLSKKFRLPVKDFRSQRTASIKTPSLIIRVCTNQLSHNRFAVIISAKTEPKSTRRHTIKRKIISVIEKWPNLRRDFLLSVLLNTKDVSLADFKKTIQKELEQIIPKLSNV